MKFICNRDEFILEKCTGKSVLHIGATDWPHTEKKLSEGTLLYANLNEVVKSQVGIDLDKKTTDFLNDLNFKNSKVEIMDMNKIYDLNISVDIILFTETIEHVVNAGIALENLKKIMKTGTELIISTPNSYAVGNFFNAIKGREVQHPDHSLSFTHKTLLQLLHKCDLEVSEFLYTSLPKSKDSIDKLNWKGRVDWAVQKKLAKRFPVMAPTLLFVAKKDIH